MNFTLLLAWRYLFGIKKERSISHMILICFAGILVGSFSLTLVTIVMNGFEKATYDKIRGLHAPIIMDDPSGNQLNFQAIAHVINNEFPSVEAFAPTSEQQIIMQHPNSNDITTVVMLKGIDAAREQKMNTVTKTLLKKDGNKSKTDLPTLLVDNNIIIGYKLAQQLEVQPGDEITILFAKDTQTKSRKITLTKHTAIVSGIIKAGIEEVDNRLAVCSLNFLEQLFPDTGVMQITIRPEKNVDESVLIENLHMRLGLDVYSWKTLYPALVSALVLEKYAMFFILALITLVASMNIISLLFMYITHKKGDIAVLCAMGMQRSALQNLFVIIGMSIAFFASVCGLLFAYGAGYILQNYPFITLPDTYYVSHLPAHMEWSIFVASFIVIMIISLCASWFPARRTKYINIANVLRFEA